MNHPTLWEAKYVHRLQGIQLVMLLLLILTILRLFHLQIIRYLHYTRVAESVHVIEKVVPAERGKILTWDEQLQAYYPLATNVSLFSLSAVPNQIKNPDLIVAKLKAYMPPETDWEKLKADLSSNKQYLAPLMRKMSEETALALNKEIKETKLTGLHVREESYRYYPEGLMAANVLGFVNLDREGQYGVEGFLDDKLHGDDGSLEAERDALGRPIALGRRQSVQAKDGIDVVLTIDRAIQYVVEQHLKQTVESHRAEKGSVIIMDPKTGNILAMAQYPTFDPNSYNTSPLESLTNMNTQQLYEPGSVFKVISMAMGIDLGLVSPSTTYVDTGELKIADRTIKNSDGGAHGVQTMTQVLEKSLNTGASYVGNLVGKRKFVKYLEDMGFMGKSGLEVAGETVSNVRDVRQIQEVELATMSFGQGIAVTPISMLRAVAALANDGKMPTPRLVSEYIYPNGAVKVEPEMKQVFKPQTANLVAAMMVSVVEKGHGKRAGVAGYRIAGKTGTAQIPGPGGYLPDNQTIGTFVGFGPVEDPAFVMLTRIDKPSGVKYAESTAAPIFGDIAKFLMQYMQVPPTR